MTIINNLSELHTKEELKKYDEIEPRDDFYKKKCEKCYWTLSENGNCRNRTCTKFKEE